MISSQKPEYSVDEALEILRHADTTAAPAVLGVATLLNNADWADKEWQRLRARTASGKLKP
jgi:hypothetical protein